MNFNFQSNQAYNQNVQDALTNLNQNLDFTDINYYELIELENNPFANLKPTLDFLFTYPLKNTLDENHPNQDYDYEANNLENILTQEKTNFDQIQQAYQKIAQTLKTDLIDFDLSIINRGIVTYLQTGTHFNPINNSQFNQYFSKKATFNPEISHEDLTDVFYQQCQNQPQIKNATLLLLALKDAQRKIPLTYIQPESFPTMNNYDL